MKARSFLLMLAVEHGWMDGWSQPSASTLHLLNNLDLLRLTVPDVDFVRAFFIDCKDNKTNGNVIREWGEMIKKLCLDLATTLMKVMVFANN